MTGQVSRLGSSVGGSADAHSMNPARRTLLVAAGLGAAVAAMLILPWAGMNAGFDAAAALHWLDPDRAFVYISVHHVVEGGLALAFAVLLVAAGWSRAEFGLVRGNVRLGLRVVAVFAVVYTVLTLAFDFVPYVVAGSPPPLDYPFTAANVVGVMAFELLIVGLAEEIMFRGLMLGLLARVIGGSLRVGIGRAAFTVSVAGIVTAVLFAAAHTIIYSDRAFFLPFEFHPNWMQVGLAFGLGIYYAAVKERTGSLLAAVLSHNLSDALYMGWTFLAVAATS